MDIKDELKHAVGLLALSDGLTELDCLQIAVAREILVQCIIEKPHPRVEVLKQELKKKLEGISEKNH